MYLKHLFFIIIISFLLTNYYTKGENLTSINETSSPSIEYRGKPSGSTFRSLFLLFIGCLLTTLLIIAMIITYNRVTGQHHRQTSSTTTTTTPTNTNLTSRFQNIFQSIGLNNFFNRGRMNFFSISNNNHTSGHHRQGETSRTHLNENQDEALLFDDPYADGGISGGIHGTSTNPYKSLTLAVT